MNNQRLDAAGMSYVPARRDMWARMAALALLAANAAMLVQYIFGYHVAMHSDSAAKVLIAREIVDTGSFFPPDWNHVNGDLFVLFGHLFVIPLLGFMPAGFETHALAGLACSALLLFSVWLVSGMDGAPIAQRILVVAVFAGAISGFMAENLYGQVSYGITACTSCIVAYCTWKAMTSSGRAGRTPVAILFVTVGAAACASPQRAVVFYIAPALLALYVTYRHDNGAIRKGMRSPAAMAAAALVVALLAGGMAHAFVIARVNNIAGAGSARWLPFEEMGRNAGFVLKGFLATFGGLPAAGQSVTSISGAYGFVRFATALCLMGLMVRALYRLRGLRRSGPLFLGIFTLASLSAILFLQITTTIPDMSDPIQSSRYLVPSMVLLLLVVLSVRGAPPGFGGAMLPTAAVALVLALSAYPNLLKSSNSSETTLWGMAGQHDDARARLVRFLGDQGLRYGYATYWNAGVLSVLSDERTLVRQIAIEHGVPIPMRHLSSNRWYRPSAWTGETFLLLTRKEAGLVDWNRMRMQDVVPARTLDFEDYQVFVFPTNIAGQLAGWDTRYENPAVFGAGPSSMRQTGRWVAEEGAVVAGTGQVGAVHFGPYANIDAGSYAATFDLNAGYSAAGAVRIDVAGNAGQNIYAEELLLKSEKPQRLVFTLDRAQTIELRVWALGNARVAFKRVTLERVPAHPNASDRP